ncbi:MAG: alpha/beta fold hydrolase [Cyclobacteriaceae bacterium]|nr:alpha/beta fold hydrolase [Cyclobacteriaceae bacterium]
MAPYHPPALLFTKHLETIYPALLRNVKDVEYERERITTPDHDFLDLDWVKQDSKKLVIISHGLEGSSDRAYIKGMAKIFYANGFDALAWNYRGCSGEMNKKLRFYHSGATDDLGYVIQHAESLGYSEINLIGFSLGGNLTLKYAGEQGNAISLKIKKIVTFSVPLNLRSSCEKISVPSNWMYSQRFLKSLKKKVADKSNVLPELNVSRLPEIKTLLEFDNTYTAPLHGFRDAFDYYHQCSAIRFVSSIQRPTLIVNALNDPFLSADCYPTEIINPNLTFEYPQRGGHVGFALFHKNGLYWSELRALDFIQSTL